MSQLSASQVMSRGHRLVGTQNRFKFQKIPASQSIAIKDANEQTMFKVRPCDSAFRTKVELVDEPTGARIAVLETDMVHGGLTAYAPGGEVVFKLHNANMFPGRTFLIVHHLNDMSAGQNLFLNANWAGEGTFEFKGSWSGKDCGMFIAGSETKIAQMHPPDDNNAGFLVVVEPDVNCEFVLACFAAVETMKSVAQQRKRLLRGAGRLLWAIAVSLVCGSIDG